MNNEKYNQLIDKAYQDYSLDYEKDNSIGLCLLIARMDGKSSYRKPSKEMFEGMLINDESFAAMRGFESEVRNMTFEEQIQWVMRYTDVELENLAITEKVHDPETPTKIITIKYKNETAQIYE